MKLNYINHENPTRSFQSSNDFLEKASAFISFMKYLDKTDEMKAEIVISVEWKLHSTIIYLIDAKLQTIIKDKSNNLRTICNIHSFS